MSPVNPCRGHYPVQTPQGFARPTYPHINPLRTAPKPHYLQPYQATCGQAIVRHRAISRHQARGIITGSSHLTGPSDNICSQRTTQPHKGENHE
jgi:hypothetical protein